MIFKNYQDCLRLNCTPRGIAVICDLHLPLMDAVTFGSFCRASAGAGLDTLIIAGDYFDQSAFSHWPSQDKIDWRDEQRMAARVLRTLTGLFGSVVVLQGNHDVRKLRTVEYKETLRDVFLTLDVPLKNVQVSDAPFCIVSSKIGDVMVSHPKSYSQIPGQVARRLATKHQMHQIVGHGHFSCLTYDASGRFVCMDIGGFPAYEKTPYVNQHLTTHPLWVNGWASITPGGIELVSYVRHGPLYGKQTPRPVQARGCENAQKCGGKSRKVSGHS